MAEIANKGQELDLVIRQGGTFGPITCTLKNSGGTPINLTGYTVAAQIRKTPSSRKATGCAAVCTIVDGPAGQFSFEFTAANTASLYAGEDENSEDSLYFWDMELIQPDSKVMPLVYGKVRVFREVTKAV